MLDFIKEYQIQLLLSCGFVNILLAIFITVINFQVIKKKLALVKVQLCLASFLISDSFAFLFDGKSSTFGYWAVRIFNFLVYLSLLASLYFLCEYVTILFMGTGKFKKLPVRLLLGFILPSVGATILIISQFTGIYYYFDETNNYHRGPLYFLGFIIPFIVVNILFSFVIQYRKLINRRLIVAIFAFSILPIIAAVLQLFFYGVSLIDFGSFFASLILFGLVLSDQNDVLSKAANTDLTSGLLNTYGYLSEVDRTIHYSDITKYNGFYFDIVRMTNLNNKYGRVIGDDIIIKYGNYIKNHIESDEIVGRLGGNFFVALIKKTNSDGFLEMLKDVPVDITYLNHKETVHIAAIAGCYEINKKNIVAGQIIGATSTAITYAKNVAKKPYVFMNESLENELKRISDLEEMTRLAIENREFVPFYQPKVDSHSNVLVGAEALVRWKKDGKMISPMEFVPVMEKNGSICDLDFYVLEYVCNDIKKWLEQGLEPVCVSVNFSRKNLGNPILAEAISKVVERCNVPKELIQIEITETIDEFPMSYLVGVVEALQRYGLTVAIDDFGTGSSSINLLKTVKFDVLKIDKSFLDYKDDAERILLHNIIRMAQDIGIKVIAEGVEENEKIEQLKAMGCYLIQGYIYDKPLEKNAYEQRLVNKIFAS